MNKKIITLTLLLSAPLAYGMPVEPVVAAPVASTPAASAPASDYLRGLELRVRENADKIGQSMTGNYEKIKAALPELPAQVSAQYEELKGKVAQAKEDLLKKYPEAKETAMSAYEKMKAKFTAFKERVLSDAELIERYRKENGHIPTPSEFMAYKQNVAKPSAAVSAVADVQK